MNRVTGILNKHFGDGVVETLLKVNSNGDNRATGSFMTNEGQVFNFEINGDEDFVEVEHNHRDSEQVDDYYRGVLQSKGIEYHGDSAYLYYLGRTGEDVRCDMGGACPGGGTRCGKRCLPQGQKCRISAGGVGKGIGKAAAAIGAVGGAVVAGRALMQNKKIQQAVPVIRGTATQSAPKPQNKTKERLKVAAREVNHVLRGSDFSDNQLQKIHQATGGAYGISKKHARNRKIARRVVGGVTTVVPTAIALKKYKELTSTTKAGSE